MSAAISQPTVKTSTEDPQGSRSIAEIERPVLSGQYPMEWGSDAIVQALEDLGIDYISLNPGASYRGLHDSLVNFGHNQAPQMLVCLHEEHAVAIAHGYAKVTDRPMAVALHSNVGLMHATMALFNAFCDRVPMLVLGATGPMDAAQRRPWIDWLHTTVDQGALIRPYIKWDDQPSSPEAAIDSLLRGHMLTSSRPCAPVYISLDVGLQEKPLDKPLRLRHRRAGDPPPPVGPSQAVAADVVRRLRDARRPLILVGRVSRDETAWRDRVLLAEKLGASVLTHQKLGAAFPTEHPLHPLGPASHRSEDAQESLRNADVVLSLDWLDLGGMMRASGIVPGQGPSIISVSNDQHLHNGWGKEHFEFPQVDTTIVAEPDETVRRLLEALSDVEPAPLPSRTAKNASESAGSHSISLHLDHIREELQRAIGDKPASYIRLPSAWPMHDMKFDHPLDYLGCDGGEGIGSGPGMAVGGALALMGSNRLPIAVIGDGDYAMGANALWTAAHYRLPLLVVVANNSSYLNDEIHQDHIAKVRGRERENRWIGQHVTDPQPDLAGMASAQGLLGIGPVETRADLSTAIETAVREVLNGRSVVVDVRIGIDLKRAPRIVNDD